MFKGRIIKVVAGALSALMVVSVLLTGIIGIDSKSIMADENTYTALGGYSTLVNISEDGSGSTFRGYCLNSSKSSWSTGDTFTEIPIDPDDTSNLSPYISRYNSPDLLKHIKKVLYYGYPYDPLGLMQEFNLTESSMRSMTQSAIWHYTNGGSGVTGTSAQATAYNKLIQYVENDSIEIPDNIEMKFLTTGNLGKQSAGILVFASYPKFDVTFSKVYHADPESDDLSKLAGAQFELSYAPKYVSAIPQLDSLETVQVLQNGATAADYSYNNTTDTISFTTVADYDTVFKNLPQGNYRLRETFAPNGFGERIYYFKVLGDGRVLSINEDGTPLNAPSVQSAEANIFTAVNGTPTPGPTATNTPTATNSPTPTVEPTAVNGIKFNKTDGAGLDLEGATFELRPMRYVNSSRPNVVLSNIQVSGADVLSQTASLVRFKTKGLEITFDNIYTGYYVLIESSAPEGYIAASRYFFEIKDDGSVIRYTNSSLSNPQSVDSISITNLTPTPTPQLLPRTVNFSKTDETAAILLGGAEFELSSPDPVPTYGVGTEPVDLSTVTVDQAATVEYHEDNNTITFTTLEEATVIFNNLPQGTYLLRETKAPEGYVAQPFYGVVLVVIGMSDDPSSVADPIYYATVDSNLEVINWITNTQVIWYNTTPSPSPSPTPETYEITIAKNDGSGFVSGAELTLTYTGSGSVSPEATQNGAAAINARNSENSISFNTATDCDTVVSGLIAGEYTLAETQTPPGYLTASPISFVIDDSGHVIIGGEDKGTTVTMLDEQIQTVTSGFAISKQVTGGSAELAGAVLTIKNVDGQTNDLSAVTATQGTDPAEGLNVTADAVSFTTVSNYQTVVTGIPEGSYILSEDTTPLGYQTSSNIEFTIDDAGNISSSALDSNGILVMYDAELLFSFDFVKIDSVNGEHIPEVGITLTNASGTHTDLSRISVSGVGNAVKRSGEVSFITSGTRITVSNIPAGTYIITETGTPSGYETANPITVTIGRDGSVLADGNSVSSNTVTMTDVAKGSISLLFQKYDANSYTLLGGAKFVLGCLDTRVSGYPHRDLSQIRISNVDDFRYNASDNTISFTTQTDRTASITNLCPGCYYITEVQAPDGYDVIQGWETYCFRIGPNGTLYESLDPENITTRSYYGSTIVLGNYRNENYVTPTPVVTVTPTPTSTPVPTSTTTPAPTQVATATPEATTEPGLTETPVPTEEAAGGTNAGTDTNTTAQNNSTSLISTGETMSVAGIAGAVLILIAGAVWIQRRRLMSDTSNK